MKLHICWSKKKMQDWIKEKIENRSNYSKSLIHRTILDIKNFCDRFSHYLFEAIGIKQDGTDCVDNTEIALAVWNSVTFKTHTSYKQTSN